MSSNIPLPEIESTFLERFAFHAGEVVELDALREWLNEPWTVDADAAPFLSGLEYTLADDVWEAKVGVTLVEAAVAETGSLLLAAGPGRKRLNSLAPEIHVALVRKEQIVPGLDEALAALGARTSVLITGPSRTADIEGVLVRGIHGPKRLLLVWLG